MVRMKFMIKRNRLWKLINHVMLQILITFFVSVLQVVFSDRDAIVLEQLSNVNPDGSYSYVYKTSNGINAEG